MLIFTSYLQFYRPTVIFHIHNHIALAEAGGKNAPDIFCGYCPSPIPPPLHSTAEWSLLLSTLSWCISKNILPTAFLHLNLLFSAPALFECDASHIEPVDFDRARTQIAPYCFPCQKSLFSVTLKAQLEKVGGTRGCKYGCVSQTRLETHI